MSARGGLVTRDVLDGIVTELEQVFDALDSLASGLVDIAMRAQLAGEPLNREGLAPLRTTIFGALAAHRGLVAGAGVITAPDLLRDAPRWLEWWWTTAAGTPEALRINLDPAAPDFFDYTTADWYATPERTLARQVAGPFVDYACTNEYTITLSTPIHADGRMLGVAAADVLASSVERRVIPALTAIPRPVVLANTDGRVIASNSPQWTPGLRVTVPDKPVRSAHGPMGTWMLIDIERRSRPD
jgi:hypothetical protein